MVAEAEAKAGEAVEDDGDAGRREIHWASDNQPFFTCPRVARPRSYMNL